MTITGGCVAFIKKATLEPGWNVAGNCVRHDAQEQGVLWLCSIIPRHAFTVVPTLTSTKWSFPRVTVISTPLAVLRGFLLRITDQDPCHKDIDCRTYLYMSTLYILYISPSHFPFHRHPLQSAPHVRFSPIRPGLHTQA